MPAEDITIKAQWKDDPTYVSSSSSSQKKGEQGDEDRKEEKGSFTALIIGIIAALLFVIIVLLVIVFIFYKKSRDSSSNKRGGGYELDKPLMDKEDSIYDGSAYSRVIAVDDNEMNGGKTTGKTLNALFKVYPPSYKKPR